MKFIEFGWNGFLFNIPEDMRFTSTGGDAKSGYLRLEAEDFSFEIKWEPFDPKKVAPLADVAKGLIKHIEKSRKQKVPIMKKSTAHIFKHEALCMNIRSEAEEIVYLWYCDESRRVIIYRFAFQSISEASKRIIRQVLKSFKCHSEKGNVWSIYNLRLEVPPSFLLTDKKMTVGRSHFLLAEQKASPFKVKRREILIEYFSVANVFFEDTYMNPGKWLEKNYFKDLKKRYRDLKLSTTKSEKLKGHKVRIQRGMSASGLTTRKRSLYTNATWYCEQLNRMYSVTVSSHISRFFFLKRETDKRPHERFAKEILSSFKCH